MITTNVIQRTFHVRIGDSIATCFTIDVDGKQYLLTAKHVVETITGTGQIDIFHENQWKKIYVTLVGHAVGEIDISVLATNIRLSPDFPLPPSMKNIAYGQDVYFLGFPYGMTGELGGINRDFPIPFVKKAILSCCFITPTDIQILFLDGHNNQGFSGGPVIFKESNNNEFKVAGVISGYRYNEEPIYQGDQQLPLSYRYNTGIIISYGIKHAVDLIRANPIGFTLNA